MGTSGKSDIKVKKNNMGKKLAGLDIEGEAYRCGYYKGKAKKITAGHLILGFFLAAMNRATSYSEWAQCLSFLIKGTVSKVALWKRVNARLVPLLQGLLGKAIGQSLASSPSGGYVPKGLSERFTDVLVQDSTVLALPDELAGHFKGSVSKGRQKSSIRVQAVYSLFSGFRFFHLGAFADNDQKASGTILPYVRAGSLVIRDLGYHALGTFKKIAGLKGYFISRYRHNTNVYAEGGKVDLLRAFKGRDVVDMPVFLGKKERLACRLVAIRVPGHIAAERRRKAKNDRDKRLNHSGEYMELLGWAIFVTNVGCEALSPEEVLKAYRVRWHIEIIFKAWKGGFNISGLLPPRPQKNRRLEGDLERYRGRAESVMFMMLVFVLLFQVHFYLYWAFRLYDKDKSHVSILKLARFFSSNIERVMGSKDIGEFEETVAYYACHEKRKTRKNQFELFFEIFDSEKHAVG